MCYLRALLSVDIFTGQQKAQSLPCWLMPSFSIFIFLFLYFYGKINDNGDDDDDNDDDDDDDDTSLFTSGFQTLVSVPSAVW